MVRIALFTVNINNLFPDGFYKITMNLERRYSGLDGLIIRFDGLLPQTNPLKRANLRPNPADSVAEGELAPELRAHCAGLMRVNHAGEVAAQALYEGQGMTARNPTVRQMMQRSVDEENDHLRWCGQRLDELGSHASYLNPVWYFGSLSLGVIAGLAGDHWSLGFLAETERQVVRHLDTHLSALPENDHKSRAILLQMRTDEQHHATVAVASGGVELPAPIRQLMCLCSKVMTRTAYWI